MSKEAILIHGWDPNYYNSKIKNQEINKGIAWSHRPELIRLLNQQYDLQYFNLPGFAGTPEPRTSYYDVENFSEKLAKYISKNRSKPKVIIGYSFGGVITLDYKIRYKVDTPIVLISPAIVRQESAKSSIASIAKKVIPTSLVTGLKDKYQTAFSKYYREGTPFLKKSYDRIVREDLSGLLEKVDPDATLLVYGTKDTSTPWTLVENIAKKYNIDYVLIKDGEHNIGQTHPKDIADAINRFLK
ncbi:hypothetical protein BH10PAT1_BH10PAT1_2610 [soil metagenome]